MAAILVATAAEAGASSTRPTHPWLGWTTHTIAQTERTEAELGVAPAALGAYSPFSLPFPEEWADEARRRSVPLVLSWEPWDWDRPLGEEQPEYALAAIAAGAFDDYVRTWARAAAASEVTILLRFAPEMNGDWHAWSTGDSPRDFRNAWRHLHRVFRDEGATNVRWVFNPNVSFDGSTPIARYWPGRTYVDWLAVDGYNWYGVIPGRPYQTVDQVFAPTIRELRRLDRHLPLMIAECGAGPKAKDRWLPDLIRTAPRLGVSVVVWFEHDKETDWRMTTARLPRPLPDLLRASDWRVPQARG
jgi:hypothetical protein